MIKKVVFYGAMGAGAYFAYEKTNTVKKNMVDSGGVAGTVMQSGEAVSDSPAAGGIRDKIREKSEQAKQAIQNTKNKVEARIKEAGRPSRDEV